MGERENSESWGGGRTRGGPKAPFKCQGREQNRRAEGTPEWPKRREQGRFVTRGGGGAVLERERCFGTAWTVKSG